MRAFEALYNKFKNPIHAFIRQMINSHAQSEEITQEVFIRIYKNRQSYTPGARFSTWAWSIAKNATIDELRKLKPETATDPDDLSTHLQQSNTGEDHETTAEMKLIEKATADQLEHAMQKLTLQQREALNLRIFSELSYEEIAKVMSLSISSVKSLIHRAKTSLLEQIRKEEDVYVP